ncbi:hypothetical protein BJ969_000826 [Saccharopolyspora gloriosae]|uniref:Uncharacterized protein n=1 Tax=Saccharopolyspora gloriosae TaxID=455344 RepID=A0A840NC07_9PSEU|nr:hypothetical protein [Saccharopolyspora gloriosae]
MTGFTGSPQVAGSPVTTGLTAHARIFVLLRKAG